METFTQCACILFDDPPTVTELEQALEGWPVTGAQQPATGDDGWIGCGPGLVVALRQGGSVIVDVVDRPWPDDPAAAAESPALAAGWRAGMFGPSAAPGALRRAKEQSWAWDDAGAFSDRHRAFVRLRTVVDLPGEGSQLPRDHDPMHELTTLTEMAGDLLALRGATALFMPAGEALRSREQVAAVLRRKVGVGPPPIELWVNLRAVGLGQHDHRRWVIVDVVGMGQLRLPDQEAIFAEGQEDAEAVAPLIRSACLRLASAQPIPEGVTSRDAGGRRWKASATSGLLAPGRPVLRWLSEESDRPSDAMLSRA